MNNDDSGKADSPASPTPAPSISGTEQAGSMWKAMLPGLMGGIGAAWMLGRQVLADRADTTAPLKGKARLEFWRTHFTVQQEDANRARKELAAARAKYEAAKVGARYLELLARHTHGVLEKEEARYERVKAKRAARKQAAAEAAMMHWAHNGHLYWPTGAWVDTDAQGFHRASAVAAGARHIVHRYWSSGDNFRVFHPHCEDKGLAGDLQAAMWTENHHYGAKNGVYSLDNMPSVDSDWRFCGTCLAIVRREEAAKVQASTEGAP